MFRPTLVSGVGYCAKDRRREPLNGSEQRSCWTASAAASGDGLFDGAPTADAVPLERGLLEVHGGDRQVPFSER